MTKPVKITDTTFRDAHQSLMATRMRTESMLQIAEKIDQVGFWSLETWGGATFDVCIRFLGEDPWERLRALRKAIKNTQLQMLLRGQNIVGYRNYADDVVEKFVEKAAENGIDVFRVFDAVNDVRNLETAIKAVKKVGKHAQGTICYTISPVHTVEHYLNVATQLAQLECDSICIKDMAGMLAPQPAYELISELKKNIDLPVHLHCHSTSGMALMTYQKACEANVDILDTSFSPFAWGTSQPPVETLVAALQNTPYNPGFDMALLIEIAEYFRTLREKYYDPLRLIDPIAERVDTSILVHQIPGGMFSNLIAQLKEQNALEKLKEVLEEVPKVRKDLGYPPLVTPTSQIVGTQAVLNVISGKRYKNVPKEVKDYVKGLYGKPPAPISESVKKKIIGDEPVITQRPADLLEPELDKIPEEAWKYIKTEEDKLTYVLFPQVALEFFKKRIAKQEDKLSQLPPKEREELKEVAAVSAAIATFVSSTSEAIAVIPSRKRETISPWTLRARQALLKQGGYID
ncbi:MAG: oxaloacetate decarboxylase subunit alpha [Candidatus Bathyarchaeia archaeon]|nr:oxaloacetate decarboxylase subunit alpha [Candidatus Bathyarchaeota archaeon A05DMB-4]MDH7595152.1 oxaloacetate decarboxylase subunit alpha [Candidatus Bathyarchaeota archaeon]